MAFSCLRRQRGEGGGALDRGRQNGAVSAAIGEHGGRARCYTYCTGSDAQLEVILQLSFTNLVGMVMKI